MASEDVLTRVAGLVEPILRSLELELVDLEYKREPGGRFLRVFIDRSGGVTLDDCSAVSRELSEILDVEDFIRDRYSLEVSSPGLNRPLKREDDYRRYKGRLVRIRTFEALPDQSGNRRKTFLGDLLDLTDGVISMRLKEGCDALIPLDKVAKANLEFEF